MNFGDYINANYGATHLNPDPPHGIDGQCVNLGSSWSLAEGGPELWGNGDTSTAFTIWQTFRDPFFQVINNSANNQPAPGDLVFFEPNNGAIGTGYAGHIDVCVSADGNGFQGFDADWGTYAAVYVRHSYEGVVGWFHAVDSGGGSTDVSQITDLQVQVEQTRRAYAAKAYCLYLLRNASGAELGQWSGVEPNDIDSDIVASQEYHDVWGKYIAGYPESEVQKKVAAKAVTAFDVIANLQERANQGDSGAAQKLQQIKQLINS